MDAYKLAHGAKGIESEDFVVEFRGDKIVFVAKASGGYGHHYTLHAGNQSGVIDLHETHPEAGADQHRTVFALRRDDLANLLGEAAPMVPEFLGLLRTLRLGWLKRRNIGIARGIDPVSDEDIAAVTRKCKRRLVLDANLYRQNVFVPEFLEEVYDFPDGNFALLHSGRQVGIGFKKTDAGGRVRLFWIKRRDLTRFGNDWKKRFDGILSRLAIPPERYADYPFLRS